MTPTFDFARVRADFPILSTEVRDKPLTFLDNGATSQAHFRDRVSTAITHGEFKYPSRRSLSRRSNDAYESARAKTAKFIGAPDQDEIIFVRGATGINLIAHGFVETQLSAGDEILITHMEHHANIVPWQIAAEKTGAIVKVVPVLDSGDLDMEAYAALLSDKTKLVSVVHISNSLGTINPVREIIVQAHAGDIRVLLDGCQSVPHMPVDMAEIDCDFFVFQLKVFASTGVGVLWGNESGSKSFPYQSGGDMIERVDFEYTYRHPWQIRSRHPASRG